MIYPHLRGKALAELQPHITGALPTFDALRRRLPAQRGSIVEPFDRSHDGSEAKSDAPAMPQASVSQPSRGFQQLASPINWQPDVLDDAGLLNVNAVAVRIAQKAGAPGCKARPAFAGRASLRNRIKKLLGFVGLGSPRCFVDYLLQVLAGGRIDLRFD